MLRSWVPRPSAIERVLGLDLSAREGYLLSRVDGTTDLEQLSQVTVLSPEEVRLILDRLVREGAIEPPVARLGPRSGAAVPIGRDATDGPETTHRQLFETRFKP